MFGIYVKLKNFELTGVQSLNFRRHFGLEDDVESSKAYGRHLDTMTMEVGEEFARMFFPERSITCEVDVPWKEFRYGELKVVEGKYIGLAKLSHGRMIELFMTHYSTWTFFCWSFGIHRNTYELTKLGSEMVDGLEECIDYPQ